MKPFLRQEFELILNDSVKQEAIAANLFYETRTARYNKIIDKLNQLVKSTT